MKAAGTVIAHPTSNNKLEALKAFMTALDIKFEIQKKDKPYNKEFVEIVLQGDEDIKKGKGKKMTQNDLDDLWK